MLTTHTLSRSIIQLVLFACLALPALAGGPSWPQFRGPNQDNKSPDTGLLDKWPEGGPELIWKAKGLGYGYASVSIANGRIFTSCNIDDKTMVTALDAADGMLYTLPERLVVGLVKPTPSGHEVVSWFKLVPQGKAPSWAHPVVCGQRLYLRHAGILYVHDVAK